MQECRWVGGVQPEHLIELLRERTLVTQLGAHPSLGIGPLLETHKHDIGDILRESLGHEKATLKYYEKLLELVAGSNVMLEEYAREHIYLEMQHIGEVDKMLRKPGDIASFERE